MSIVGIDSVTFLVKDPVRPSLFFTSLGLQPLETRDDLHSLRTGAGSRVNLQVVEPPVDDPRLSGVTWGLSSASEIHELEENLRAAGIDVVAQNGCLRCVDPAGLQLTFRESSLEARPQPSESGTPRIDRRLEVPATAHPTHIGHVAYWTPALDECLAFYSEALGFRVSDSYIGFGAFLRAPGSAEHHSLYLMRGPENKIDHVSFAVSGIDEIMAGCTRMRDGGWPVAAGPGRHVVGSSLFAYFDSPCGGRAEYYADMDWIVDEQSYQPQEYRPSAELFQYWSAR